MKIFKKLFSRKEVKEVKEVKEFTEDEKKFKSIIEKLEVTSMFQSEVAYNRYFFRTTNLKDLECNFSRCRSCRNIVYNDYYIKDLFSKDEVNNLFNKWQHQAKVYQQNYKKQKFHEFLSSHENKRW